MTVKPNAIFSILFILLLEFWSFESVTSQKDIGCQLVWNSWMSGEGIPDNAVPTQDGQYYIATNYDFIGHIDLQRQLAYINRDNSSLIETTNCYILTNPNDCSVTWPEAIAAAVAEPEFAVSIGIGKYVGMARYHQTSIAGTVIPNRFFTFYTFDGKLLATGMGSYLRASINLKVKIDHYVQDRSLAVDEPDFLGYDYVENNSPVTVEHTIIHRKSITKIYDFTESRSFAQSTSYIVDVNLGIETPVASVGLNIHFNQTNSYAFGEMINLRNETEEEIISQRTILVPPFTSIQACSTLMSANDVEIPYTARASFSALGTTPAQIKDILRVRGYKDEDFIGTLGDSVLVKIDGSFTVNTPFKSKFIVLPPDDPNGCMQIQAKIQDVKRANQIQREMAQREKMILLN